MFQTLTQASFTLPKCPTCGSARRGSVTVDTCPMGSSWWDSHALRWGRSPHPGRVLSPRVSVWHSQGRARTPLRGCRKDALHLLSRPLFWLRLASSRSPEPAMPGTSDTQEPCLGHWPSPPSFRAEGSESTQKPLEDQLCHREGPSYGADFPPRPFQPFIWRSYLVTLCIHFLIQCVFIQC